MPPHIDPKVNSIHSLSRNIRIPYERHRNNSTTFLQSFLSRRNDLHRINLLRRHAPLWQPTAALLLQNKSTYNID